MDRQMNLLYKNFLTESNPVFLLLLFVLFAFQIHQTSANAATPLVSHTADYTLTMDKNTQDSAVQDVRGKISFKFLAQCDGWSLTEDYIFQFLYDTGDEVSIFSHSESWEDISGKLYSFDVREQSSYEPENIYTGFASLPPIGEVAEANYVGAYNESRILPEDTLFPVAYTRAIINAAEKGEKFKSKRIFVNSTPDDSIKTASAAIGKRKPYTSNFKSNGVTTTHFWPVDVAYFKDGATEATPEYQIKMDLHENGVVTDFLINYGEFTIKAAISDANLIENEDCGK